ncbi:hypothetical protein EDB86DRAFT_3084716 [Lactarius hatsudake]|nr:hypothetical protein EDB86DRAFT_3084716 [Lactarius hatsudake]
MTCSSSLNPSTKSLCNRRKLTNYFLRNSARNIRRSHPTITHTDPTNHDELSPHLLDRYRHHAFSLLPDIPTDIKRGRFHGAAVLTSGTGWKVYNGSWISTREVSTALPPSWPVTCSETEPISKTSPQQTQRQFSPPTAPHPLASDSAYKNEILFDPPDLATCHSLTPSWSSTHDLSYSQFKAVTDSISYPSPQSDGSVDRVFPSSSCDTVAPYLVLPLG